VTRKITAIAALAAVAVVGVWYVMLWKPVNRQVAAANSRLAAAQTSRMQAAVMHSSLLSMAAKLPAEQSKGAALTAAAPPDLDVAGVIDQINAIAAASGVTWQSESQTQAAPISGTTSSKKASGGALSSSTLTLSVSGSYAQVLGFLQRLQSMPRMVQVSTLSLGGGGASSTSSGSSPTAGSGTGTITTQISATIYVDPTPIPPVPKIKS
jgi:Tfp pilus assembly protein PilO